MIRSLALLNKISNHFSMKEYHRLLQLVLDEGKQRADRTGTGTISVFGAQARFNLRKTFPCLTTKKLHLRSILHELLWFLKGDTNIGYLRDNKVTIMKNTSRGPQNPQGESNLSLPIVLRL